MSHAHTRAVDVNAMFQLQLVNSADFVAVT